MLFRFCLWLLAKRIDGLMLDNKSFIKIAGKKNCVIQFKTLDNKVLRYFAFNMGKVDNAEALHERPSLTIALPNASEARRFLFTMAKNPDDKSLAIDAIKQGQLRFSGDVSLLTWFMAISDYFAPQEITLPVLNKTIKL